MSSSAEGRLLHIRSLNFLSWQHQFTDIGARILAESIHPEIIKTWSNEYIARKAQTSRRQVYWKHSLFKEVDDSGKLDYRRCVIGSPTTQLTGSLVAPSGLARRMSFCAAPERLIATSGVVIGAITYFAITLRAIWSVSTE